VLFELLKIARRHEADIHVRIGEHETVTHRGGGNAAVFGPAMRPAEQVRPAGRRVADDARMVRLQVGKDIPLGPPVGAL